MPLLLLLCLGFAVFQSRADSDIGLIRVGTPWKYFKGVVEPSAEPGAWAQPGFNDAHWFNMLGGLSTPSTYGEATFIHDYGRPYNSLYFRKKFSTPQPADVRQLILRIDYDDAFIAYINGTEVARRGVSGDVGVFLPAYSYGTNLHLRGYTEEIALPTALPLLAPDQNTLAVHLLGYQTNDLIATFSAELLANYTRAPYIQNTTSNSTQIIWKTLDPSQCGIEFGLSRESAEQLTLPAGQTNHVATLTNLLPATTYHYRVSTIAEDRSYHSEWSTFRTFKVDGAVSFSVLGDSGWAIEPQFKVAAQLRQAPSDLIFHVGDVVYYGFSHFQSDLRCFSTYAPQLRHTPMFVALGNHDRYLDQLAILETFWLPTNSVTRSEHYYSFDHGDVHFVALWLDLQAGVDYSPGSPQYNWLEQDLAATTKPWKFLFFHHVLRSSSVHWDDNYDYWKGDTTYDSIQMEASIEKLATKYGVQIIFNGHDHVYERFAPVRGPMSFVSGGGGAILYPLERYHTNSVQFLPQWHFLNVHVDGPLAQVRAIDLNGNQLDSVTISRELPQRRLYHPSENSPRIESSSANDDDGNIIGQTFDLIGDPISSLKGDFSNAGRLYINQDPDFVYFGISDLMLVPGQNLFLFVESPWTPGVTTMANIGNATIDPLDQGVDGFDFLANLNFTNFTPSVGFMLGDEYADGIFRSFARPPLDLDIGQGAFHLSPTLENLTGVRLQQFNLSPQNRAVTLEQNANFIEIAVPYGTLNAAPGDRIKVGMLVGRDSVDTNAQTRLLDTGGLGYAIWTDQEITWLEGVEVQLLKMPAKVRARLVEPATLELRWPATPGTRYKLEFTPRIGDAFRDHPDPVFPKRAIAVEDSYLFPLIEGNDTVFFRVVELGP